MKDEQAGRRNNPTGERATRVRDGSARGRSFKRSLGWFGLTAAVVFGVAACNAPTRTVVPAPGIPDAEVVGTAECSECHESITRDFDTAAHAPLRSVSDPSMEIGCEACHGPASIHVETGGERGTIFPSDRSGETCFQCHLDVRGDFRLPFAHPVTGGPLDLGKARMGCGDCHDPHSGRAAAGGGALLQARNETCTGCHPAQRGPWVFEHEAMREGCDTCHRPHGSVNPKMLTETNATLCQKCHFQQQTNTGVVMIGGQDHSYYLSQGTCFSAGCHEAVHGSHVDSTLRY